MLAASDSARSRRSGGRSRTRTAGRSSCARSRTRPTARRTWRAELDGSGRRPTPQTETHTKTGSPTMSDTGHSAHAHLLDRRLRRLRRAPGVARRALGGRADRLERERRAGRRRPRRRPPRLRPPRDARGATFPAGEIAAIREQTRAPLVIVTAGEATQILEDALDADVEDILLLPQLVENVVFTIKKASHAKRRVSAVSRPKIGRVITVFSPKGGTGKTVTATNLAAALAKHEAEAHAAARPRPAVRRCGDRAWASSPRRRSTTSSSHRASSTLEKLAGYIDEASVRARRPARAAAPGGCGARHRVEDHAPARGRPRVATT